MSVWYDVWLKQGFNFRTQFVLAPKLNTYISVEIVYLGALTFVRKAQLSFAKYQWLNRVNLKTVDCGWM